MRTHPSLLVVFLGTALTGFSVAPGAWAELPLPASGSGPPSGPARGSGTSDPRHSPVVEVVRRVRGAVVNIHSERTVRAPAAEELFSLSPSQNRVNGMGTGIVIDPRGYII